MGEVKSSWRFVLGTIGIILVASFLYVGLLPERPSLSRDQIPTSRNPGNRPGGPSCDPAQLAQLRQGQALEARDRCQKAAEDYRIASDNLKEQTRSAEAEEAVADLTYQQSRMMAVGTAFGFVTLVAAIFAVLYARWAAGEARRGANADEGALRLARQVSAAELRPYLFVDRVELTDRRSYDSEEKDDQGKPLPGAFSAKVTIYLRNFGKVPARKITVYLKEYFGLRYDGRFWGYIFSAIQVPICAPGHERRVFARIYIPAHQREDFDIGLITRILRLRFTFEDELENTFEEKAAFILYGEDLDTFYLLTDVRVAEMRKRAQERELEYWSSADQGEQA